MAAFLLAPTAMRGARHDEVLAAMLEWSESFIEQPHPAFAGLPVCPFARAARLRGAIRFEVMAFDPGDELAPDGAIMRLVAEFAREGRHQTLFVIHPDARALDVAALEAFVRRLEARLRAVEALADLRVFEAHPESGFSVGGAPTRRSPYPSFQVLGHSLLKQASDSLRGSGYYDGFSEATLRAVGMPRE